ncbi:MAG: hypothetical protein WBG02_10885 [Candidatus Acidiferrum sp.]
MTLKIRSFLGSAVFAGALLSAPFSGAQQQATPAAQANAIYDVSRETVLSGKVLSYTADSTVPPVGAHVTVQTVYGAVDVHLGSAKLLEQKNFTLQAGDSVRITGEVLAVGQSSTFAARIVEDGNQSITVRNEKGRLILFTPVRPVRGVR